MVCGPFELSVRESLKLKRSAGIEGNGFGSVLKGMPEMVEEIENREENDDGGRDGESQEQDLRSREETRRRFSDEGGGGTGSKGSRGHFVEKSATGSARKLDYKHHFMDPVQFVTKNRVSD